MANVGLGSQRRTKLTSSEAALLAGELTKPSWESKNEGIHERVSFEDSIWGFDLAGGLYYRTPLRVTAVKRDSRAEKAGIRPGDKLLRINDIDTSTLTIQEAHAIIIESGVHIRLAVSAPEDTEDSYNCYQDPIEELLELERQRKLEEEKKMKRRMQCKINQNWSLQWPWVSKRRVIYKESNCYMVPSKYEVNHRDKFPEKIAGPKAQDDIVLHGIKSPVKEKDQPIFSTENKTEETPNGKADLETNTSADQPTNDNISAKATDDEAIVATNNSNEASQINVDSEPIDEEELSKDTNEEKSKNISNEADTENIQSETANLNETENNIADQELEDWNPNESNKGDEEDEIQDLEELMEDQEEINAENENKIIDDDIGDVDEMENEI